MRWLLLIATFLLEKFLPKNNQESINPVKEMKEFFIKNGKKVMMALTLVSSIALVFAAGLSITVITLASQYDLTGTVFFTGMLAGGLTLMLFSIISAAIFFSNNREQRIKEQQINASHTLHPLEEALVNLISDYIKEKESKRKTKEQVPSETEAVSEYDH